MKTNRLYTLCMAAVLTVMTTVMTGCDNDPYYDYDWFEGRTFAAYANPGDYNELWVATFGYDGKFSIMPCDQFGNLIPGMEVYRGNYSVDYDDNRLFLSYYGYSMNAMWTYIWWDCVDPYTDTYPDMEIYTSQGFGPLDNLTFTPY